MLRLLSSALALLIATSQANPIGTACSTTDANYDDVDGGVIAQGALVTTYKTLKYTSWSYASDTLNLIGGVSFSSPHTAIFTSAQVQNGLTPGFSPAAGDGTTLTLQSFYFGCVLPLENGAANKATQCTIHVAGFVKNFDQEVAVATFTFTPGTLDLLAPTKMVQAVLPPTFVGLNRVTVVQTDPLTQVLLLDDVTYCLKK